MATARKAAAKKAAAPKPAAKAAEPKADKAVDKSAAEVAARMDAAAEVSRNAIAEARLAVPSVETNQPGPDASALEVAARLGVEKGYRGQIPERPGNDAFSLASGPDSPAIFDGPDSPLTQPNLQEASDG